MNLFEEAAIAERTARHSVYIRECEPNERVSDLVAEAHAHKSILAYKVDKDGKVIKTAIVPFIQDGWIPHGGLK